MTDTPSGPVSGADPDRVVEVLPRYLAGRGTCDLATVWPFPADQGWTVHAPHLGQRIATSSCQRVRCGNNEGRPWVVEARRDPFAAPAWGVTFAWDTPTELLAAFHAQLLRSYGSADRPLESFLVDHAHPVQAYLPLLITGWKHEISTSGWQTFTSPDGLATVRHRYAPETDEKADAWTVFVGERGLSLWSATFTAATPVHLLAAFTTSVVAKAPLIRNLSQVPTDTRPMRRLPVHLSDRPPAAQPQVPGLPAAPGTGTAPGPRR
ncbi:DUF317 domain-containing protein [Streptomyces sp. NBC_00433]